MAPPRQPVQVSHLDSRSPHPVRHRIQVRRSHLPSMRRCTNSLEANDRGLPLPTPPAGRREPGRSALQNRSVQIVGTVGARAGAGGVHISGLVLLGLALSSSRRRSSQRPGSSHTRSSRAAPPGHARRLPGRRSSARTVLPMPSGDQITAATLPAPPLPSERAGTPRTYSRTPRWRSRDSPRGRLHDASGVQRHETGRARPDHTMSRVVPKTRRPSMAACASAARSSGNVCPITGAMVPAAASTNA